MTTRWALIGLTLATVPLLPKPAIAQRSAPWVAIGPNARVIAGEYGESWIAASSTNPNVLVATVSPASNSVTGMDVVAAISRDGGRTWAPVPLPGGTNGFDPMVAS